VHSVQVLAPASVLYVPAVQFVQVLTDVALTAVLNVPAVQRV
jgi:hypothetical protein